MAAISFAEPEILSLPEETLQAIVEDEQLADHKFTMENLLRQETAYAERRKRKNCWPPLGRRWALRLKFADNLQDADLVFDSVQDGAGNTV